jgi:ubiquinone biosynthesis protein
MALGFMMRDPSLLARSVRRMAGREGEGLDMSALEFDLGLVLTDVAGGGFDPQAIQEVVRVLNRHGVRAPSALTVLGRAALTIEGTLRVIDPEFRMAARAQDDLKEIVGGTDLEPRAALTKEAVRSLPSLRALPQLSEDLALQARAGRLTLRTERFDGGDGPIVAAWLDDLVFAALAMVGLIGSALLLVGGGMAGNSEIAIYLRTIGFTGLVVSTAMQMRVVAKILNRRVRDYG